ncbi:ParA family protein [Deinococcus rubellus]|uniref:ParA family protein n=1 Tax=Deinococcus rubellus TaxID=1889240 RepID=UPI0031E6F767
MKTVTLFNHAGGAGKTSITLNAGYELARSGLRVLLIDLDPQANLTTWLGVEDPELSETVHPVATEGRPLPQPRRVHGLDLIPSRVDLALAEAIMPGRIAAELSLHQALQPVRERYDVVLIDSPPSVGKLAALGALASDSLIVPIQTRNKGINALPGLSAVMHMYHGLRPNLNVALYVPTMYDARRSHDRDMLELIRSQLSPVAEPLAQRESVWMDSGLAGVPVGVFAPSSKVADDVRQLTRQIATALQLPYPQETA